MIHLNWSVGISVIQLSVSILAGVTALTKHWGVIPSESIHFGLIDLKGDTDDVIALLMVVMLLGMVVSLPYCILEIIRGLRWNIFLCFVSGLMALLAFAAMIHSIVLLSRFNVYFYYSWSFGLGWLTVIIAVASGVLSFFTRKKGSQESESSAAPPAAAESQRRDIGIVIANAVQSFLVFMRRDAGERF